MEFTLIYNGTLKANGKPGEKQAIRRIFHQQLKQLWSLPPLISYSEGEYFLEDNPPDNKISIIQNINSFRFAPLVTERLLLIAELNITFLRPEPPGRIITQSGDIDNRIKTLLDSLRIPQNTNEIPTGDKPNSDENPFFCLLEDDNLISKLSVETDMLLDTNINPSTVLLLIHVKTKVTELIWGNMGLGS